MIIKFTSWLVWMNMTFDVLQLLEYSPFLIETIEFFIIDVIIK